MRPKVSVIIPCYNGARFLADSIGSVLGQSFRDFELIVVDDGSTDESPSILAGYGEAVRVIQQANAGLPAARNAGIRAARGELLAFLDADDYWHRDFLTTMVSALEAAEAAIAYCGWQNVGLSGGRSAPFIPPDYEHDDKLALLLGDCRWPVHGAIVRHDIVTSSGAFDETLTSCEDFDLWLRIGAFHKLVRVPEVLAYYRFHGGEQITKNRLKIATNAWRVQQKFVRDHPDVVRRLTRARLRQLSVGQLLQRGYERYWDRDFEAARAIFRTVMREGYGRVDDWKYMLPSLLPIGAHRRLVVLLGRRWRRSH